MPILRLGVVGLRPWDDPPHAFGLVSVPWVSFPALTLYDFVLPRSSLVQSYLYLILHINEYTRQVRLFSIGVHPAVMKTTTADSG